MSTPSGSPTTPPYSWQSLRGAWLDNRGSLLCQQSDQTAQLVYGSTGWATQQVKATILFSGGSPGVIARYVNSGNSSGSYYAFTAYAQSTTLRMELVSSNLNRAALATYSGLIGIGKAQNYEMTFDCQGSNLRGFVNGIKYFDITDSTLSAGQVGFDWQQGVGQIRDVHVQVNAGDKGNLIPVTLPTDFGAYCSVDDVKNLLAGIPIGDVTTDDDIYQYIKAASDHINRETYSYFGAGTRVEERYDGNGQFTLVLTHSPIFKLHRLEIYNFNNTLTRSWSPGSELGTTDDSENTGSLIQEKNYGLLTIPRTALTPSLVLHTVSWQTVNPFAPGVVTGADYDFFNRFGRGIRNIVVDYSYGYEVVPPMIRWAAAKWAGLLILMKLGAAKTGGATQIALEGMTLSFIQRQGPSTPFGAIIDEWSKDVEAAIADYRRRPTLTM